MLVIGVLIVSVAAGALTSSVLGYWAGRSSSQTESGIALGLLTPVSSPSSSCEYDATQSGNWNDPNEWNPAPLAPFPNTLPEDCTALIPTGLVVVVPDGLSVTILGTTQNGGSLTVDEYARITFKENGVLNISLGGTFHVNIEATVNNTGGVIDNNGGGMIAIGNLASLYNGVGATIKNAGSILIQSGGDFLIQGGNVINSGTVSDRGTIDNSQGGTITNSAGGTITNDNVIDNAGTINNAGAITNSGSIVNNGVLQGSGSITGHLITPGIVVSCFPATASIGSRINCGASIRGTLDSTTGEPISFATNRTSGSFSPSSSCTLSSNSCTVTYEDSKPGASLIRASYSGDSNDGVSSGITTVLVAQSATGSSLSSSTESSSSSLTSSSSTISSTGSGGGAIPEFPSHSGPITFTTLAVIFVYVLVRRFASLDSGRRSSQAELPATQPPENAPPTKLSVNNRHGDVREAEGQRASSRTKPKTVTDRNPARTSTSVETHRDCSPDCSPICAN